MTSAQWLTATCSICRAGAGKNPTLGLASVVVAKPSYNGMKLLKLELVSRGFASYRWSDRQIYSQPIYVPDRASRGSPGWTDRWAAPGLSASAAELPSCPCCEWPAVALHEADLVRRASRSARPRQ